MIDLYPYQIFFRAFIPHFDLKKFLKVAFEEIYDSNFKGTVHLDYHLFVALSGISKGRIVQRMLKEDLITDICGWDFPRSHRFYEVFDRKTQQLFNAGITHKIIKKYTVNPKKFIHLYEQGPKVLSMNDLEAGFVVWLISITFAVLAFLMEWLMTMKDFLILRMIFKTYFDMKIEESRNCFENADRPYSVNGSKFSESEIFSQSVSSLDRRLEKLLKIKRFN